MIGLGHHPSRSTPSMNLVQPTLTPFGVFFVCAYHGDLQALMIHKDHVSAVMDVSFSPTGQEFASGSYDRTVRVFPHRAGRSREVYHTKRMQRVFCVNFSADARYVCREVFVFVLLD